MQRRRTNSDGQQQPPSGCREADRERGLKGAEAGLRLVRAAEGDARPSGGQDPIQDASDPRWVLAQRTCAGMQGGVVRAEVRQRLMELGQRLGLSSFAARLVISIVQEQTRRGFPLDRCPENVLAQLAFVPRGRPQPVFTPASMAQTRPRGMPPAAGAGHAWPAAATVAMILGAQLLLCWYLLV